MLESPAFRTTSKEPLCGQVIHRLIIIKDGYVWMLNCEDSSGKSADYSLNLFDGMINTLNTSGSSTSEPVPSSHFKQPVANKPSKDRSKNVDSGNTLSSPPSVDGSSGGDVSPESPGEPAP